MYGLTQVVGPVQPLPPHCPYSCATPVGVPVEVPVEVPVVDEVVVAGGEPDCVTL